MLIKCPECGKEISSDSDKCIGCGFPMIQKSKYADSVPIKEKPLKKEKIRIVLGILIFFCLLIMQMSTGFNLPIYYAFSGLIILVLRKKNIGSVICLIPLFIGNICFIMYDNYNSIVGGLCWLLTISIIVSIFIKEK